jgi:hypothetical protein
VVHGRKTSCRGCENIAHLSPEFRSSESKGFENSSEDSTGYLVEVTYGFKIDNRME